MVRARGAFDVDPAVVQSQLRIDRAAIHPCGFRFETVNDVYDARFLPGAAKYGDLSGLISLAAPANLWLAGEQIADDSIIRATWSSSGKPDQLTIHSGESVEPDAVDWLLARLSRLHPR